MTREGRGLQGESGVAGADLVAQRAHAAHRLDGLHAQTAPASDRTLPLAGAAATWSRRGAVSAVSKKQINVSHSPDSWGGTVPSPVCATHYNIITLVPVLRDSPVSLVGKTLGR